MINKKVGKILVPLDGSKNSMRGLEMAIGMARQCSATVTGIISIETPPQSEFKSVGSVSEKVSEGAKKIMEESKTLAAKNGIVFVPKVMHGNVGYNIIKVAHSKSGNFDMIIMGSRGRGAVKEMFFGSTSNYVIHTSKIPVLIVK